MDAAAESSVPEGVARAAVTGANQKRRQRFAVLGTVAAVVAAVTTFAAVAQPFNSASDEPGGRSAAHFPDVLPAAGDLAPLAEAPMDAASAAYIIDGEVVLVNAATGEAVRAFASEGDFPPSLSGAPSFQSGLSSSTRWDRRVALTGWTNAASHWFRTPCRSKVFGGRLIYLLNVGSGDAQRLLDVAAVKSPADRSGSDHRSLLGHLIRGGCCCACFRKSTGFAREAGLVTVAVADPGPRRFASGIEGGRSLDVPIPIQVAYGGAGPAYQLVPDGPWFLYSESGEDVTLGVGTGLGLGAARDPVLLAGPSEYEIRSVDGVALGRGSLEGQQVIAVGAARAGFVMTLGSPGPAGAPLPTPLDVILVGSGGSIHHTDETSGRFVVPLFCCEPDWSLT